MEKEKTEMTTETKPQPKGILHMAKDSTSEGTGEFIRQAITIFLTILYFSLYHILTAISMSHGDFPHRTARFRLPDKDMLL